MRARATNGGITALAVAGNHVVVLGWDLTEALMRRERILGFAVRRTRASDGEVIWLSGLKTFEAIAPDPDPGVPVSSFVHPLQTFQWSDYTASPAESYTYRIVAMGGIPGALNEVVAVDLTITTEAVDQGRHAIFFNRGAIASQEYARRFQNLAPDAVGQAAYDWLSRGLIESLEKFIDQAMAGDSLEGAFFEFKNMRIYKSLASARTRGVTIKILYDGDSQLEGNDAALQGSRIKSLTKARSRSGGYAHNKFLVFSRAGAPAEVWTGSTNLSENGIFGHSNNAHLVRDPGVAAQYHSYWKVLLTDRTLKPTATATTALSTIPADTAAGDTVAVFSPRASTDALDWYSDLAKHAERSLFMTFAFGMNKRFVPTYDRSDSVLRFALMEKKGNGARFKEQAAEIDRIRRKPNTVVAVGAFIPINAFDRWLAEIDREQDDHIHVRYVHTKYMLIDPLGPGSVVVIGSANFSDASATKNDENMLVIRGNDAVADVYLGEFMRLFSHYAFRESLKFKGAMSPSAALRRKYLCDSPAWIDGVAGGQSYFAPGSDRSLRRLYFSGQ